jgi:hypothetical protein
LHGHRVFSILGVRQPINGDAAVHREVDRRPSIWQLPSARNDRDPEGVPTKGERCLGKYAGDLLLNPFVFINQPDHSGSACEFKDWGIRPVLDGWNSKLTGNIAAHAIRAFLKQADGSFHRNSAI